MTRFFDILFSGLALLLLSPILIPIMIILKFSGEGEIFYTQSRTGQGAVPFQLIKFATMLKNSASIGAGTLTVRNDPRVLPVGKFLRKTKINELPQLINIFKGDMSFVGPRPLHIKQFSFYSEEMQKKIASVRPGLTGAGSLVFRDEEQFFDDTNEDPDVIYKTKITPIKASLESWYVDNQNLVLYFLLIIGTAIAVVFPKINFLPLISKDLEELQNELLG